MHPRITLSVGNFFFSLFSSLVTITLLPYLSLYIPTAYTGLVVALGATCALMLFPFLPSIVERYGVQYIALLLAFVEMIVLLALAGTSGAVMAVVLMTITLALEPIISYELDIMLEATIADTSTTGRVRGIFRTASSMASLASPLLIGALLVQSDSYSRVFLVAASMLVPFVLIFSMRRLPKGPIPKLAHMRDTLHHITHNRDLAAVTFGNLLLYLFLVWMPFYTPIYLHNVLGISWSDLGWIFSLMLIPYAVVEYPAGWLADKFLGDKELMFVGFLLAGGGAAALSFLTPSTPLTVIAAILVISRIGAALIESMVDAHFFRRISKRDINSVSVFKAAWPLAFIIAPILGSLILIFGDYSDFFLITGGFIAIAGTITTLLIKDFR